MICSLDIDITNDYSVFIRQWQAFNHTEKLSDKNLILKLELSINKIFQLWCILISSFFEDSILCWVCITKHVFSYWAFHSLF